jgi:hypothetical protein
VPLGDSMTALIARISLSFLMASSLYLPAVAADEAAPVIQGGVQRTHALSEADAATAAQEKNASDTLLGVVYSNCGSNRRIHKTTDVVIGYVKEPANVNGAQVFGAVMMGLQMTNTIMNATGGYGGGYASPSHSSGGGGYSGGGYSGGSSCSGH